MIFNLGSFIPLVCEWNVLSLDSCVANPQQQRVRGPYAYINAIVYGSNSLFLWQNAIETFPNIIRQLHMYWERALFSLYTDIFKLIRFID